ncbi:MAG: hypothetical protein LBQ91_01915 [Oscillospiraceae bacterium]|nr:hypothetical protein [Oscillospiraceae bacterium]
MEVVKLTGIDLLFVLIALTLGAMLIVGFARLYHFSRAALLKKDGAGTEEYDLPLGIRIAFTLVLIYVAAEGWFSNTQSFVITLMGCADIVLLGVRCVVQAIAVKKGSLVKGLLRSVPGLWYASFLLYLYSNSSPEITLFWQPFWRVFCQACIPVLLVLTFFFCIVILFTAIINRHRIVVLCRNVWLSCIKFFKNPRQFVIEKTITIMQFCERNRSRLAAWLTAPAKEAPHRKTFWQVMGAAGISLTVMALILWLFWLCGFRENSFVATVRNFTTITAVILDLFMLFLIAVKGFLSCFKFFVSILIWAVLIAGISLICIVWQFNIVISSSNGDAVFTGLFFSAVYLIVCSMMTLMADNKAAKTAYSVLNAILSVIAVFFNFAAIYYDFPKEAQLAGNLILLPFLVVGFICSAICDVRTYIEEKHPDKLSEARNKVKAAKLPERNDKETADETQN